MGLPVINHPTFTLTLPSTQQKISYRPFLVKEEKILLIAQSASEQSETLRAIKQVITNCIVDTNIKVDSFTTFDLEYFFLKLRSKSVNNIVSLTYRDNEDLQNYTFDIDLEQIEVTKPTNTSNNIKINDDIGIILKYPQVDLADQIGKVDSVTEFTFALLKLCIDQIYTADEVFKIADFSTKEVDDFLMSMDVNTYKKIQEFFDNLPKLEYVITYTNKMGNERKIFLRNLEDFFTLG